MYCFILSVAVKYEENKLSKLSLLENVLYLFHFND